MIFYQIFLWLQVKGSVINRSCLRKLRKNWEHYRPFWNYKQVFSISANVNDFLILSEYSNTLKSRTCKITRRELFHIKTRVCCNYFVNNSIYTIDLIKCITTQIIIFVKFLQIVESVVAMHLSCYVRDTDDVNVAKFNNNNNNNNNFLLQVQRELKQNFYTTATFFQWCPE